MDHLHVLFYDEQGNQLTSVDKKGIYTTYKNLFLWALDNEPIIAQYHAFAVSQDQGPIQEHWIRISDRDEAKKVYKRYQMDYRFQKVKTLVACKADVADLESRLKQEYEKVHSVTIKPWRQEKQ